MLHFTKRTFLTATKATGIGVGGYLLFKDLIDRTPPKDTKLANPKLTQEVNDQALKMGITNPITVYTTNKNTAFAYGLNASGSWNSMQITLGPKQQKMNFVIAHETAHLKNNDSAVRTALEFTLFASFFSKAQLRYSIPLYLLAQYTYGRYAEKRADLTAAKFCSNVEIKSSIRNLDLSKPSDRIQNKPQNISESIQHLYEHFRYVTDVHPAPDQRIEYLTNYMNNNNGEDVKIKVLTQYDNDEEPTLQMLTDEQSQTLHNIIASSRKKNLICSLEKIILYPERSSENLELYYFNENLPVIYTLSQETLTFQHIPAITESISNGEDRPHFVISTNAPASEMHDQKMINFFREQLNFPEDEPLAIRTLEEENSYVLFSVKPFNIISERRFELNQEEDNHTASATV